MCVEQNGTQWNTGKKFSQLPGAFGTEIRCTDDEIRHNSRAESGVCTNLHQFAPKNKRCYGRLLVHKVLITLRVMKKRRPDKTHCSAEFAANSSRGAC